MLIFSASLYSLKGQKSYFINLGYIGGIQIMALLLKLQVSTAAVFPHRDWTNIRISYELRYDPEYENNISHLIYKAFLCML